MKRVATPPLFAMFWHLRRLCCRDLRVDGAEVGCQFHAQLGALVADRCSGRSRSPSGA